ncbi:hypothetical protein [Streptomyces sp. NBC_00078]|uniref:hypothetical protein n=1 Tax=unclassified Streptomyces TaxID=2593676 RepID=UPI00225924FE|nr:hypothetical protein [Streptomyces sp. NBC_00078]MCX5419498.1 hypothetical protein [Streptomyces sp. NBC_00078]
MAEVRVKARKESVFAERFGVFAECLLTGVWIAVASVGVVTYAAAFAAGARHLRRCATHEGGGRREFVGDFRTALRRGWAVGLAGWVAAGLVWVDVQAVRAGLPGGPLVGAGGLFALIGAAVAGLRATAVWEPGESWRVLLAAAARRTVLDPAGSFLLVGGVVLVVCSALLIAPLAVPVLGAVAAAAVAVEERYRRR